MNLQWVPSHFGLLRNEADDHLGNAAHQGEELAIHTYWLVGTIHLIQRILRLRHPDMRVLAGIAPPTAPHRDVSRTDVSLLHRLVTPLSQVSLYTELAVRQTV